MLTIVDVENRSLRYRRQVMQPVRLDLEKVPASHGSLVVRLNGKLALETVHNFIETLRNELAQRLVIDMSGVSFMDSAGVGALVSLFISRRNGQRTFALAPSAQDKGREKRLPVRS